MKRASRRRVVRALLALIVLVATVVYALDPSVCTGVASAVVEPGSGCDRACSLFTGVSLERGAPSGLALLGLKLLGKRLRRV